MRAALLLAAACATAAPLPAKVALSYRDPEADVSVDGAPAGKMRDYQKRRLTLTAGAHRIEVRTADGRTLQREFVLGPGDQIALALDGGDK